MGHKKCCVLYMYLKFCISIIYYIVFNGVDRTNNREIRRKKRQRGGERERGGREEAKGTWLVYGSSRYWGESRVHNYMESLIYSYWYTLNIYVRVYIGNFVKHKFNWNVLTFRFGKDFQTQFLYGFTFLLLVLFTFYYVLLRSIYMLYILLCCNHWFVHWRICLWICNFTYH